jgi:hypothetical protein
VRRYYFQNVRADVAYVITDTATQATSSTPG